MFSWSLLHSWLSCHTLGGTRSPASASCTVLAGRGGVGRLKVASCCSIVVSSALVLPRTSIFQVPVRSMAEMAVLTVACVARQLKTTRQIQAAPRKAVVPSARRAGKASKASKATGSMPFAISKIAPTA